MSELSIFSDTGGQSRSLNNLACIASFLDDLGVRFERWPVNAELDEQADAAAVLDACRQPVELVRRRHEFEAVDVLDSNAGDGETQLAGGYRQERPEALFFVDGESPFYMRLEGRVYRLFCEKGDLVGLPAGSAYWFDTGNRPRFKCIRFF